MKEELISVKTDNLAKIKGCDLSSCTCGRFHECICTNNRITQSLLQKYLREVHNIDIIIKSELIGYSYLIYNRYPPKNINNIKVFEHYEEALEDALYESLQLIKNNINN